MGNNKSLNLGVNGVIGNNLEVLQSCVKMNSQLVSNLLNPFYQAFEWTNIGAKNIEKLPWADPLGLEINYTNALNNNQIHLRCNIFYPTRLGFHLINSTRNKQQKIIDGTSEIKSYLISEEIKNLRAKKRTPTRGMLMLSDELGDLDLYTLEKNNAGDILRMRKGKVSHFYIISDISNSRVYGKKIELIPVDKNADKMSIDAEGRLIEGLEQLSGGFGRGEHWRKFTPSIYFSLIKKEFF